MKLNLGCGKEPLEGFDNLDKKMGWLWEGGLPMYDDESVEAITVSHSLMYVKAENWPFIFSEMHRVLKKGGVLRITEDSTDDPASERYGGHHEAVSLTTSSNIVEQMIEAKFCRVRLVDEYTTCFKDDSLLQNFHGGRPKCFFIESVK